MGKIAEIKLPKTPPLPSVPAPPKQSVESEIYRNNRESMRTTPMTPQVYPTFMGRKTFGGRGY
jgi:hypothetical protein